MLDLELLHHFSTSTAYTFHLDPSLKTLWRISVPQVALGFDFVMREVLGLSALHLAYCKPERKDFYLAHAMTQHQAGLQQATSMLANVSADTCTAVYIFTAMACIFSLASPRKDSDILVVGDTGMAEWLVLLRGTRSIIEPWAATLREGLLGPMFIHGMRRHEVSHISKDKILYR